MPLDPGAVRHGRVRGRYFRENFAQGGIDLVQIVPELVTNADAAIAASGRRGGRIELSFGKPDAGFRKRWRRELGALGAPALLDWRHELVCVDDGEGVDADLIDRRLGALGVQPPRSGQRGLFGRGLRDVWLAQGGGRIQGVRDGRLAETWFFPAAGDEPYAYVHVRDEPAAAASASALGLERPGTRVTVPLAQPRLPPAGRLRTLVSQLVQLRPVLEDPERELWLALPGESAGLVTYPYPEPDAERPLLFEGEIEVAGDVKARISVRRAAVPFTLGPSRATRRGGLVIRSGRAAHEATLAGHEGRPGALRLYGEVRCEAIEQLQREALDSPRPQVVVRVDRGGLNEHHPVVRDLYAAIDGVLRPIVADEERRAGAHLVSPGKEIAARDGEGLRALNDALRAAFETPGKAAAEPGGGTSERPASAATVSTSAEPSENGGAPPPELPARAASEMRFKRSPIRVHPGERRATSLVFDPGAIPAGTPVTVLADEGLALRVGAEAVPEAGARGWSRIAIDLRARVSLEPGSRLSVLAEAGEHTAELEVLVVRHTASGWVREIARKDEDQQIEARFDPDTGVVTVYEGRREFKALERAARQGGIPKRRVREYLPYRMLEVEVAANAVYSWAAERIVARRGAEERAPDGAEYARAVQLESQALRHRFHGRLMRAFLEPEVFEGSVRLDRRPQRPAPPTQTALLEG
ncbi:MAG: hypothetical protein LC777_00345 [Actinobacteria bacterium]|nr:hypothetical protein [Actinomycetota bacterium]